MSFGGLCALSVQLGVDRAGLHLQEGFLTLVMFGLIAYLGCCVNDQLILPGLRSAVRWRRRRRKP